MTARCLWAEIKSDLKLASFFAGVALVTMFGLHIIGWQP